MLRNTTFQNVDAECVRLYSDTDTSTVDAYVLLEHLTLNHCNTRTFYVKNNKGVIVRDWIISNDYVGSHGRSDYTGQLQLEGSTISNMDLYNLTVADLQATKGGNVDSATVYDFDPMYADEATGDFSLLEGSPAYGKAHDSSALGDLRWAVNSPVGVEEGNVFVNDYILSQNYPNPFNPATKIQYTIPAVGRAYTRSVQLIVYDVLGNEIATLVNKEQTAGNYEVDFNASGLSSGMYFYSLTAGGFSSTKKMILLK